MAGTVIPCPMDCRFLKPLLGFFAFVLAVASVLSPAHAQVQSSVIGATPAHLNETGAPLFTVLGREALGLSTTIVDLKRMPDGRLFALGRREFAIGDGTRWEVHHQEENEPEIDNREALIDGNGNIYMGTVSAIARVDFGPTGRWRLTPVCDLSPIIGSDRTTFNRAAEAGGEWFWSSGSGSIIAWKPGTAPRIVGFSNFPEAFFLIDGVIHASDLSNGDLFRMEAGKFQPVHRSGSHYVEHALTAAAQLPNTQTIVGTMGLGLLRVQGNAFSSITKMGPLADGSHINDVCALDARHFAVAVENFGIGIFDTDGRTVVALPRSLDHRISRVRRLLFVPGGDLWGLLNEGIVRLAWPTRYTQFDPLVTSAAPFAQPYRIKDQLWIISDGKAQRGLFTDNRLTGFEVDSPPGMVKQLIDMDGVLVGASREGIFYQAAPRDWRPITTEAHSACIRMEPVAPGKWMLAADDVLGWIHRRDGRFEAELFPAPTLGHPYGHAVDGEGAMWVELGASRICRVRAGQEVPVLDIFGSSEGIPPGWVQVFVLDGVTYINVQSSILRLNTEGSRFVPAEELLRRIPTLVNVIGRPARDASGKLWITQRSSVITVAADGAVTPMVGELPRGMWPTHFFPQADGVMWLYERGRLARYDPSFPPPNLRPSETIITKVMLPVVGSVEYPTASRIQDLAFNEGSLLVSFALADPSLNRPESFEYRLEGQSAEWVSTGSTGSASFSQLPPRDYRLHIRSRIGRDVGPQTSLFFTVTPPWYRHPLAIILAALDAGLLIAAAIVMPSRLARRRKEQLEELVSTRTRELAQSEERFRQLNVELEERVSLRTDELRVRVAEVERLNAHLDRTSANLQDINARLVAANQELESFSYSVSHDLRAPLRNITGFVQLLQKRIVDLPDKEARRYVNVVITEATRMGALIDDLLAFSRIGRAEMQQAEVNLETLIDATKDEFTMELNGRSVLWTVRALPKVVGDAVLLRQVFSNLIGNALKFTRGRHPAVIEIGAVPMAKDSGMVDIYVRDNGVGYNPSYKDKLFGVFQRLHAARDFEGTGIGLANVKRIVARHGGEVWAEGEIDKGATFHFSLRMAGNKSTPHGA